MPLAVVRDIRDNKALRRGFDALAQQVFGISFESWYQAGYWTDRYLPYLLVQDGTVLACAAANLQDLYWDGRVHRCIQIGTVMTAPQHRGQGFARRLIGEILQDWRPGAELIFLFANPSAAGFYQKLGFVRRQEYRCSACLPHAEQGCAVPLDLSRTADRELLWAHSLEGNPYAAVSLHRGYELLLFYLMRDPGLQALFLPQTDTIAILQRENGLTCLDLLGGRGSLVQALCQLGQSGTLPLGFTPREQSGFSSEPATAADPLFILPGGTEPDFDLQKLCFPLLAHC